MEILTKEKFEEFSNEIKTEIFELKKSITNLNEKKILKNKELKQYLGCSYSTIEKLRQNNILPYRKILGNYYYSLDDVNKVFLTMK